MVEQIQMSMICALPYMKMVIIMGYFVQNNVTRKHMNMISRQPLLSAELSVPMILNIGNAFLILKHLRLNKGM
ncbi:hypothetical protein D3C78_1885520 [compost metagenome]